MIKTTTKFEPGHLCITPTAAEAVSQGDVIRALQRHLSGDWGDLDAHDLAANEAALLDDARLFSSYHDPRGTKFWIITEADRSSTTVLLPEDY